MKYSLFSVSDYYPDVQSDPSRFILDQVHLAVAAEQMGYHAYFNAEHHFHEYGLIPDPAVLLAAAAMKTERIRLGPAVSLLTFQHPLRVAEQWALFDQLSHGRLILGVGSGYLMHEFEGFNLSPAIKRERFDETLDIMEKALTGKRFSHEGKYYTFKNVRLNVTTYHNRELPIAIAILSEMAAYYIGRRGYDIMTIPYASVENVGDLAPIYGNYRKGWSECGKAGTGEVITAVHTHVGDKDADHDDVAREHLDRYVFSRLYARHADYDECRQRGVVAMGNPGEVAAALQRFIDAGADHLMFIFNFGAMPMAETLQSMELTMREVIPQLMTND